MFNPQCFILDNTYLFWYFKIIYLCPAMLHKQFEVARTSVWALFCHMCVVWPWERCSVAGFSACPSETPSQRVTSVLRPLAHEWGVKLLRCHVSVRLAFLLPLLPGTFSLHSREEFSAVCCPLAYKGTASAPVSTATCPVVWPRWPLLGILAAASQRRFPAPPLASSSLPPTLPQSDLSEMKMGSCSLDEIPSC